MCNPGLVGSYCVHYRAFLTYKLGEGVAPAVNLFSPQSVLLALNNTVMQTIYTQDTLALGSEKSKRVPNLIFSDAPNQLSLKIALIHEGL
jgi:hypothetical protein